MSSPDRSPFKLSRPQFDRVFKLHELQPWTSDKHDQLYALLAECDDNNQFHLILDLLTAYENFDEQRTRKAFIELKSKITDDWALSPSNTLIAALHNKDQPGSAQSLIQQFKPLFSGTDWRPDNFICNLKPILNTKKHYDNIVFIDDFIGTGNQLCKSIDWFSEEIKNLHSQKKTFFLAALCIMNQAIQRIESRNITHFATHYMVKGILDRYSGRDLNTAQTTMHRLEDKLQWRNQLQRQRYSFGYEQSEALFRFMENNAPNNNFPVFWWRKKPNGDNRNPLQERF